jgi:uncharacterized protein
MLTPDLVRTRRRGGELTLQALDKKARESAVAIADRLLRTARDLVGERRAVLEEALRAVEARPNERRLADGLIKLLTDACDLGSSSELDPTELRRSVFERAAEARRALPPGVALDRAALLAESAAELGLEPTALGDALYADLRGEERLRRVPALTAETLVDQYERAARQAVLLRAIRVVAEVQCRTPAAYRALFAKLKFRRLLHRIERSELGYRIEIDGPFSLFESVTKYGLALALTLPVLEECDTLRLSAELSWGPRRDRLTYRYVHAGAGAAEPPRIAEEVSALIAAFDAMETPWRAAPSTALLDLPGLGVIAPDLELTHAKTGARVQLEVLGFWSRDAVWKRVELAERGLPEPVLFAVSSRLRVSEDVLEDNGSGALYVYKGVMSARAIERRLAALVPVKKKR